jgi:hypothetical protein
MSFIFDGENKIIQLEEGVTSIDVLDLYSRWKRWTMEDDNLKYEAAFRSIGGDELTPGVKIAPYIEALNDWRVKPYNGDYVLNVNNGTLFVSGGASPFLQADEGTVLINMNTSANALSVESENCNVGYGFI